MFETAAEAGEICKAKLRKRLEWISNLPALAKECHYHPGELATKLGMSTRWLEIVFKRHFQMTPHALLAELRAFEGKVQAHSDVPGKVLFRQMRSCF